MRRCKLSVKNMQMSKRKFIKATLLTSVLAAFSCKVKFANKSKIFGEKTMSIELPNLPYERNALAPHISEETLNFHYGKHHQAYVTNLNKLIADTDLAGKSLEEIIKISAAESKAGIFNNSAQVWNHTFYWNSMKPNALQRDSLN